MNPHGRLAVGIAFGLCVGGSGLGDPAILAIEDEELTFDLVIGGESVGSDMFQIGPVGVCWTCVVEITEDEGAINDALSVTVTLIHNAGPHGHPQGFPLVATVEVDADDFPSGLHIVKLDPFPVLLPHGWHRDKLSASLWFTVDSSFGIDTITQYRVFVQGFHGFPVSGGIVDVGTLPYSWHARLPRE